MPALPSDLFEELVQLCAPLFRQREDRDAQLLIPLSTWTGFETIEWEGNPRAFTTRLVHKLPGIQLKDALRHLLVDHHAEERIADLEKRVDDYLGVTEEPSSEPFARFYQMAVAELSEPRYQIDSRFVNLTLLVDQGSEAEGPRFIPDGRTGKYSSLNDLIADESDRAFVLLGRPGGGKTTLLRRLQIEMAWTALKNDPGEAADPIPFFVPLNAYRSASPDDPLPGPVQWLAQEWQLRHSWMPPFERLFEDGRLLLLLDGLNEIPHRNREDYAQKVELWQHFVNGNSRKGNLFVFSCRKLDLGASLSSEAVPVRQVRVEPLQPSQIEEFLHVYLPDQAEHVFQSLAEDESQMRLFDTPFFLQLLVDQVDDQGQIPAGQAELLTGFVRRALRREMNRRQPLFLPGDLLSEDDCQQIQQTHRLLPFNLPNEGPLFPDLAKLAFSMQDNLHAEGNSQVRIRQQAAQEMIHSSRSEDLLRAGVQLNVLDKDLATQEIFFYHQLLQEYFAARVLAIEPDPERVTVAWEADKIQPSLAETLEGLEVSDPLPGAPTTGWEETTVLAAAMARDQTGFVSDLMEANLPLAARCAASPEVSLSPQVLSEIQQALLERIGDPKADLRARIAAAEALGDLGDPRFTHRMGMHGAYLEPPVVKIPGGDYPIGSDDSPHDDEKPAHTVEVEPFEVGVYAVTNAEYRLFIEAGGYEDERWWETEAARAWLKGESGSEGQKQVGRDAYNLLQDRSEAQIRSIPNFTPEEQEFYSRFRKFNREELDAWLDEQYPSGAVFRQPQFWEDSRFNGLSRPVVGLTWFEAQAYCAWLSVQTGQVYELPTEAEWEAAAGGAEGRDYAYEGEFDPAKCNTFETHIRGTTPVGVFPQGRTPEGVHDLSGNVWEWTTTIWGKDFQSSEYGYPYDGGDGREDPEDGGSRRVVRGGSWDYALDDARAAYRFHDHPAGRGNSYGFRIVRRPPSRDH
jgi:formylglycine-generating enzyme required for sulfatase activity